MKVLVDGDRGYVGAVLVPLFQQAGHEVVGLDAGWYDGCDFGAAPTGYESRTGDIRDQRPEDLEGFDAVVHLAAISNDPVGHLNPEATYSVNAHGAAHMAQVAKEAGVPRFLFSSSCSLYGSAGDAAVTEQSDFNPVTPYGESKVMAEQLIGKLADDDFSPIVPPQRHGVRLLTAAARRHRGQQPDRHRVHPRRGPAAERRVAVAPAGARQDISRAFLAMLEADRDVVHDQAFNIGRDEDVVQIRDIATRVAERMSCPVTFAEGAAPDKRDYRVDFGKVDRTAAGLPAGLDGAGRHRASWPPTWSASASSGPISRVRGSSGSSGSTS